MPDTDQKPTTISDIRNDDSSAAKADLSSLPEVDPAYYTLGKEVGRGGMGRVMEARDLRVGRSVVLKELLDESPSHALRFEREARVTARLQHPAIVPIYEIGKWPDGAPFYAMRMVEGRNLRAAITDTKTLAERLALLPSVIVAAEAIAYAHAHRVIHRDLKPSNIMVGNFGETVVIDWGLAKDLGDAVPEEPDAGPYRGAGTGELTVAGAVVGTPAYMPPEQARGEAVDERGDVYSLGAILYHLLAGEAPFRAGTSEDLLAAVKAAAPVPIAERAPEAPRDLLSIVDKAMAREPTQRYANAAELVAELVQFRTGQLVGAHRYSRRELVRRWIRHHRALFISGSAALAFALVAGAIALVNIVAARDRAEQQAIVATREKSHAETLGATLAERLRESWQDQGRRALLEGDRASALLYFAKVLRDGGNNPALQLMIGVAREAYDPRRRIAHARGIVASVSFSPDGRRLASVTQSGHVQVWDVETLHEVHDFVVTKSRDVEWSPNGSQLAIVQEDRVSLLDSETGRAIVDLPSKSPQGVAFTPDGTSVVTWTIGVTSVWRARDGALLRTLVERDQDGASMRVDIAPDGSSLVVAFCHDGWQTGHLTLWSLRSPAPPIELKVDHNTVDRARYDPTGRWIAAGLNDFTFRIFDARTGAPVRTLVGNRHVVHLTAWSSDGTTVAGADAEGTLVMRDMTRVHPGSNRIAHTGQIAVAEFVDASTILTIGYDRMAYLWDRDGTQVASYAVDASNGEVSGSLLATHTDDVLAVWDLSKRSVERTLPRVVDSKEEDDDALRLDVLDDARVVRAGPHGLEVWDPRDGSLRTFPVDEPIVAIATDDHRLGVVATATQLRTIDLLTGRWLDVIPAPHQMRVAIVGDTVFGATAKAVVTSWSRSSGQTLWTHDLGGEIVDQLYAYDRVGEGPMVVAIVGRDAGFDVIALGMTVRSLVKSSTLLPSLAYSPTKDRFAILGQELRVIDGDARPIASVPRSKQRIVAWLDADRLVIGDVDGSVEIVRADTLAPEMTFRAHARYITAVLPSADGKTFTTAAGDSYIRVWDAKTFTKLYELVGTFGVDRATTRGDRLITLYQGRFAVHRHARTNTSADELGAFAACRLAVRLSDSGGIVTNEPRCH